MMEEVLLSFIVSGFFYIVWRSLSISKPHDLFSSSSSPPFFLHLKWMHQFVAKVLVFVGVDLRLMTLSRKSMPGQQCNNRSIKKSVKVRLWHPSDRRKACPIVPMAGKKGNQ